MFQSVAFDPGGVTGWSVFCVHDKAMADPGYKILDNISMWTSGEFFGKESSVISQCIDLCAKWPKARVVSEDFILLKFSAARELLSPVRINAVLEYELRVDGRYLSYQMSSLAADSVTDERLRSWGFWNATAGQKDARSAVRHNLTFLRRTKEQNLRRV